MLAGCGAGGEQALELARGGEQVDAAQGGEDALFVAAGFASVFDELQVPAWAGGLRRRDTASAKAPRRWPNRQSKKRQPLTAVASQIHPALAQTARKPAEFLTQNTDREELMSKLGLKPGDAVDTEKFGRSQTARDRIVEHDPSRRLALPADRASHQQHLLRVPLHPEHDEEGYGRRLAIEPHPHRRAVADQPNDVLPAEIAPKPGFSIRLYLAPCAADHVLAGRAAEKRGQSALHQPRVRAGGQVLAISASAWRMRCT